MPIHVDPTAFGTYPISGEHVIVSGVQVNEIAVGLEAAGERFMRVNELGREYTEEEFEADNGDLYTPNYVSEVEISGEECELYVDCRGEIQPAMRTKFTEILLEELHRQAVVDARVFCRPYDDV